MKGNPPLKFAGPCTPFLSTKNISTTRSIPCPVWISKEALSAFPPSIISKQMENRFGIPKGNITGSLNGRTTPDIIVWEYAPESDSEEAMHRGLVRPRRFFGPTRTRSNEAECHGRALRSLAPSHFIPMSDVLAELSSLDNLARPNFLAKQQHPSMGSRNTFRRQSFLQEDPSQAASNHENGAASPAHPGLPSRQERPASSSERELRRGAVSSRAPHDLAQRLERAIRALRPPNCDRTSLAEETSDDPLVNKGGEKSRRTPRTIRRRLGRAVRTLQSQANTNLQPNSPFASRENHPLVCGGDATSKFNSIPPMNPQTSKKSYCEICNERDAGSPWSTYFAPHLHDPIKMIHSIDLFGGDLKPWEIPTRKTQSKAQQTPDFMQRDHLRLFLRRKRLQDREQISQDRTVARSQDRQQMPQDRTVARSQDRQQMPQDRTVARSQDRQQMPEDRTVARSQDRQQLPQGRTIARSQDRQQMPQGRTVARSQDRQQMTQDRTVARSQNRQQMPQDRAIARSQDRQQTPPTLLAHQLGMASRNAPAPRPTPRAPVPLHVRDRGGRRRAEEIPEPPSPVRTFKPPPSRGFAPGRAPLRRTGPPFRRHKAVQVGVPLPPDSRFGGGRDLQRGIQRKKKKKTTKATRSPKRTLLTNDPSAVNDPEMSSHQPLRKQKTQTRPPQGKSRNEESQAVTNEQQNDVGLNKDNYFHISISMHSLFASSGNEQEYQTSTSTSSGRSIFSIQKLQDMISLQNYIQ